MSMDDDPSSIFFPDDETVDLYGALYLKETATSDEIKKAYRRLALVHHPDKHASASAEAKAAASLKFQQVSFSYTVLSDEKRRKRYDETGKTDEGFELAAGEDGWETYFEQIFDRVTRGKLDEMKKEYQGSQEEIADLQAAYVETKGSIGAIMTYIPHSTTDDEARFIAILSNLITKGELPSLPDWVSSSKDEKARLVRRKQGRKEAAEAEELAKELGVWDEFYGTGKPGSRKGKGKGKGKAADDDDEGDTSALQALILKKREKSGTSFFDSLAAKYAEPEPSKKSKGKKRGRATDDDDESRSPKRSRKTASVPPPPDIDDEEFEKLQQKLFGQRAGSKTSDADGEPVSKPRAKAGRKAKR